MNPTLTDITSFQVCGLTTRTINRDEFNPKTAKIPDLWTDFFSGGIANQITTRIANTPIFCVYSNYDTDASSFYDVTAGVCVTHAQENFAPLTVQDGKYLVFEANGPMPSAVIQAWTDIWTYFEQHPEIKRSFLSDFEAYVAPEAIKIYIGISS